MIAAHNYLQVRNLLDNEKRVCYIPDGRRDYEQVYSISRQIGD